MVEQILEYIIYIISMVPMLLVGVIKQSRLMRTEWWPQPHTRGASIMFELDNAAIDTTTFPIIIHDEGLGTPSAIETHPENAAFVVSNDPNCHVNSRVDNIFAQLRLSLTSKAIDDNLTAVRCAFMVQALAFKEDYIAIDELSSLEVQDILELQTESTDRQGGPLYTGTDMPAAYTGSDSVGAAVPFLTTDDNLEAVAFIDSQYYNSIHYLTIEGKMKKVQSGLKWLTLTPNRPTATIRIHQKSSTKRMNEYAFLGCMVHVPVVDSEKQIPLTADITAATNYVRCDFRYRYNEWNPDFNFKKV